MARRRMTVKRIDPWSVLKFGFLANIVLLIIFMMIMGVVWFIVDRLQLVDQVCGIATDVGFTQCGINAANLFRSFILLGLLWVVVQTAVLVFFAFMYNLISDLTGGLGLTIVDDTAPGASSAPSRQIATAGHQPGATSSPSRAPARASASAQAGWTGARDAGRQTSGTTEAQGAQERDGRGRTGTTTRTDATSRQAAVEQTDAQQEAAPQQAATSPDASRGTTTRARATTSDDELFGDR